MVPRVKSHCQKKFSIVALCLAVSACQAQNFFRRPMDVPDVQIPGLNFDANVPLESPPRDVMDTSGKIGIGGILGSLRPNLPTDPPIDEDEMDTNSRTSTFSMTSDIFDATVKIFSEEMIQPYTSTGDLEEDLTEVLKFYVTGLIRGNQEPQPILFGPTQEIFLASSEASGGAVLGSVDASDATDFETNNQEEGVDESDLTKSDGTFVYTAYGDVLVVWDALTGELITNLTMPEIMQDSFTPEPISGDEGIIFDQDFVFPSFSMRPDINGLLLTDRRLTVFLSGYGGVLTESLDYIPALYDRLATRIIVYSTESLRSTQELVELYSKDIDGRFKDARAIDSTVHVVTSSGLDMYSGIITPLGRWQPEFTDLSPEDYKEQAKKLAEEELIPQFVKRLMDDIIMDGELPDLAGIGLWQSVLSDDESNEQSMYLDRVLLDSFVQVTSFDMETNSEELDVSMSGMFMPSSYGYTYSTPDMLIFATRAWNWMPLLNGFADNTYLLGFSLDGASSTPTAIGSLPGYILNQYSLDIFDDHLRIATTIESIFEPNPVNEISILPVRRSTENQVVIMKIPSVGDDGEPGLFEEVARIPNLGKEFEIITTVRFFDNVAYAVTFERTDPFYVLDLSLEGDGPSILGELNITGFSSYLHPINNDNTKLLAVGQEADESGAVLGAQLTIFDATNPADPQVLDRYTIEQDRNTWSSSTVAWDYKAFRYVDLTEVEGNEKGVVILPMYITSWQNRANNFDGFLVLDVFEDEIIERFNITHARGEDFFGCYYPAFLPPRSLVFRGDVTTMKGHSVISTDLTTGQQEWELDLLRPSNPNDCIYW